jgi:PAS domain-containing protein
LSIDIDEAKKAEDRLRRSEAYLAEAQRLSHVGAFSAVAVHGDEHFRAGKALARRIVYWSEENYRIWGFDPLRGLPDDAFLHHEIQRRGDGAVDLSVDHRSARRPPLGRGERTPRRRISVHVAAR